MLSLFPQILFLAPFSALLIRLSLATVHAYAAWQHIGRRRVGMRAWALFEIAVAIALVLGIWTQGVALLAFLGMLITLFTPILRIFPRSTLLLSLALSLSLVVTGAGAFAFDLPL